jgi:hypothetical protein
MLLTESPKCALHDPVLGEVLGSNLVFRGRKAEEDHGRDAERLDPVYLAIERFINREMTNARHRFDLPLDSGAVDDENRLNEIARSELVLAHQTAQGLGAAAAAGTLDGSGGHEGKTRERGHPLQPRDTPWREPGMTVAAFLKRRLA